MALTLTELNKHFYVPTYKLPDGNYRLCSLTEHGRSPYKYLCSIYKKGTRWGVVGYDPTSKIDVIKEQVEDYVKRLEYNSEYFDPSYRNGVTESLFVHDYMASIGFNSNGDSTYYYSKKNIYDKKSVDILVSFRGLEDFDDRLSKTIKVNIIHDMGSITGVEANRNIKDIKEAINCLLQPFLLVEGLNLISSAVQMTGEWECNWAQNLITTSDDVKLALKKKLLDIAELL